MSDERPVSAHASADDANSQVLTMVTAVSDAQPVTPHATLEAVTPGTRLNERWKSQVDVIAWYLKQLKYAGVPVIWRPYHEMNGGWFWWGKRAAEFKKLYRMMFDRLVGFHGLDNLLWTYGANETGSSVDAYDVYYPGSDVVDILATDVYHGGFASKDYEALLALAGSKPIALAEVGTAPSEETLAAQPRWAWFMNWHDPSGEMRHPEDFRAIYESRRTLTWEELPWVHVKKPTVHYPVLK